MKSMTGYGEITGEIDGRKIDVILKSTNHKHFVFSSHLPEALRPFEPKFEKLVRRFVERGRIDLNVQADIPTVTDTPSFRTNRIQKYLKEIEELQNQFHISGSPSLDLLVQLPGVVREHQKSDLEWVRTHLKKFKSLMKNAAEKLDQSRRREGDQLQNNLQRDVEEYTKHLEKINELAPEALKKYRKSLSSKLEEVQQEAPDEIKKEHLHKKIWKYIEKYDIQEELDRLNTHVEEFKNTMQKSEAIGRKADFIAQEILRETNTIAAKNKYSELSSSLITMKSAIKSIREQLQNIE